MWIAAIIWNTIAWVAMLICLFKDGVPHAVLFVVAIFPLIGLGLMWAAVRGALRSLRHGRPQLRLDRGSWTTGSRVQASLLTRTQPQPGDSIAARLVVSRRVTTGSDDNRSSSDHTLWSLDLAIDAQGGQREDEVWAHRVELPLPSDVDPTAEDVTWRLHWHLIRPGPDLSATFALPVVAGSGEVELKAADLAQAADGAAPLAVLQRAGIRVSEERGEVVITLPAWRNPGMSRAGLIASAVLTSGAVALWQGVGWWTALLSVPLLLLCWRGALRSALWSATITLGAGRIAVTAGWWRRESTELKAAELVEVEQSTTMKSGETAWYNMWLKTADGTRIAIVRAVPGPAAARIAELIQAIRQA